MEGDDRKSELNIDITDHTVVIATPCTDITDGKIALGDCKEGIIKILFGQSEQADDSDGDLETNLLRTDTEAGLLRVPNVTCVAQGASSELVSFNLVYLWAFINKLTMSQQLSGMVMLDTSCTKNFAIMLGLFFIGKLVWNAISTGICAKFGERLALILSTIWVVIATSILFMVAVTTSQLQLQLDSAKLAFIHSVAQFFLGMSTGNRGAIQIYITGTNEQHEIATKNFLLSRWETCGYILGPVMVVVISFTGYSVEISSSFTLLMAIPTLMIVFTRCTKRRPGSKASRSNSLAEPESHQSDGSSACKIMLTCGLMCLCSSAFPLYITVASSITRTMFSPQDIITGVVSAAVSNLVASVITLLCLEKALKKSKNDAEGKEIPKSYGLSALCLSYMTLLLMTWSVPSNMFTSTNRTDNVTKEESMGYNQNIHLGSNVFTSTNRTDNITEEVSMGYNENIHLGSNMFTSTNRTDNITEEVSMGYNQNIHLGMITVGLTLASIGTVICKIQFSTATAKIMKAKGQKYAGICSTMWLSSQAIISLIYGMSEMWNSNHVLTILILPSIMFSIFVLSLVWYCRHKLKTCFAKLCCC